MFSNLEFIELFDVVLNKLGVSLDKLAYVNRLFWVYNFVVEVVYNCFLEKIEMI